MRKLIMLDSNLVLNNFLKRFYFYVYMCECLAVYVCTVCMTGASGGQMRTLDPLELELWKVVSPQVGAWYSA